MALVRENDLISIFADASGFDASSKVKKIVMVGAQLDRDNSNQMEWPDHWRLLNVVSDLIQRGVKVHPDCEFQPVDGNCGQDFLDMTYKGDVVVFCFLTGLIHCTSSLPEFWQSSRHHEDGVWLEAVRSSGAQAVYFFPAGNYLTELTKDVLDGSEYADIGITELGEKAAVLALDGFFLD